MRPPKEKSFLAEWASDPQRVAAIAPSGRALARLITSEISVADAPVIELGPGTGVFTTALLDRGVPADKLALVELSDTFAARLRRAFPHVAVMNESAADLARLDPFGGEKAGGVISGLGLLAMSEHVVSDILGGVFHHLKPGAALYQFTYGWRCPVPPKVMDHHGLKAVQIGRAWVNLPPAQVYKITRKQ